MTVTRLLFTFGLACCCTTGWAQKIAPGLWEHTVNMGGGAKADPAMVEMRKELAAMPAAQRAQMEAAMAGQGIKLGAGASIAATAQACITPEQAARDAMPQHDARCKQTRAERSGDRMRFAFSCSGEPPSSGEGEFVFSGNKAYSGVIKVATQQGGKPQQTEMQMSARWLSASCGAVKPGP